MRTPPLSDVGSVNCWRAFVKQNTLLDCGNNECQHHQWLEWNSFCANVLLLVNLCFLQQRCATEKKKTIPPTTFTVHTHVRPHRAPLLWHYVGLIKSAACTLLAIFQHKNDSNKNLIMSGHSVWKQLLPLPPLIKHTQCSFILVYSTAGTLILIIS